VECGQTGLAVLREDQSLNNINRRPEVCNRARTSKILTGLITKARRIVIQFRPWVKWSPHLDRGGGQAEPDMIVSNVTSGSVLAPGKELEPPAATGRMP
jgi:hypothetical protein